MKNGEWRMENCGGLPHCGLDPQSHPFISLNQHRDTEQRSFSSDYKLCVSVPLCLYLQEIPGQARDEDGGDRHALRAEPVPECNSP